MNKNFDTYRGHINQMSASTQNTFMAAYKKFPKIEDLIDSKPDEEHVYDTIQEWINGLNLHPRSIQSYFSAIRQYLYYRGIRLHQLDIQHNIKLPKQHVREIYLLNTDEIGHILEGCDQRHRILYFALLSSGMRIGELVQIRREHLHDNMERIMVKIPATFTRTRRGRTTFFSQEVSRMLGQSLEGMKGSDLVFVKNENMAVATGMEVVYMNRLVGRIGLDEKYETNGWNKITTSSFRDFFITQVSQHDLNLSMMFAGQKGYIRQYDRLTDEEKLEKYIEVEPDLIIRNYEQIRKENKELKARLADDKETRRRNIEMRPRNSDMRWRIDIEDI